MSSWNIINEMFCSNNAMLYPLFAHVHVHKPYTWKIIRILLNYINKCIYIYTCTTVLELCDMDQWIITVILIVFEFSNEKPYTIRQKTFNFKNALTVND